MNASELNRKLLYCGYTDLADHLKNSPLNRRIYKILLVELPSWKIDIPIVTILNEIYYQCIRVRYDGNPGVDVPKRYLKEEEHWLNSGPAAELVFCFVWAFFKMRRELSFNEECFMEQLQKYFGSYEPGPREFTNRIVKDLFKQGLLQPDEIPPMPCPVSEIPLRIVSDVDNVSRLKDFLYKTILTEEERLEAGLNPFRIVTNNFSHSTIESYVQLYTSTDDQTGLLKRIENACPKKEYDTHREFFVFLQNKINLGVFNNFRIDYELSDWSLHELDSLKNLDAQQKRHEEEMSELEAKYKSKIRELEAKLADASQITGLDDLESEASHVVVGFTIEEMVAHVKERFSKAAADEFVSMYYHLSMAHGDIDETDASLIDSIIPAIILRDAPRQTVEIPHAGQVNINPQAVNNHFEE